MITKVCEYRSDPAQGENLVRVFHPGDVASASAFFGMQKIAAPLLPEVQNLLESLHSSPNKIYVLVNALGASEYWGQNINGDIFPEASLIHEGVDYGYKTFYNAHPFKHHVNKDPKRSFGDVLLSVWNPHMKRVELVIEIDRDRAERVGATDICDKLDNGTFMDVSMGCKVPYDLCTICTDWKKYHEAEATYDPHVHANVGKAVLAFHKHNPIRGLSPSRLQYCDHLRHQLNRILPDGRKVGMINKYPRFFDISFVFIGADKTAKVMAKLAGAHPDYSRTSTAVPSWYVAEMCGYGQECDVGVEKTAGSLAYKEKLLDSTLKDVFGKKPIAQGIQTVRSRLKEKKASSNKLSEIIKDIVPSQFHGGLTHVMDDEPDDLPRDVLDSLGSESDIGDTLSTASSMGMLLKPKEFQRIVIVRMGNKPLADKLDDENSVFPLSSDSMSTGMLPGVFRRGIGRRLMPFMRNRSCFEPIMRRRVINISISPGMGGGCARPTEIDNDPLLSKISSAYNGYLSNVVDCVSSADEVIEQDSELWKEVYGDNIDDLLYKTADNKKIDSRVLLGALGGAWLLGQMANVRKQRAMEGAAAPPSLLVSLAADHPKLLMAAAGLGALHQQGSTIPTRLLGGLKALVSGPTN